MTPTLPPLPEKVTKTVIVDGHAVEVSGYTTEAMQSYALAYGELVRDECLPAGWVAVPKEPTLEMHERFARTIATEGFGPAYVELLVSVPPIGNPVQAELAGVRKDALEWRPIESAPKDETRILIGHYYVDTVNQYSGPSRWLWIVQGCFDEQGVFWLDFEDESTALSTDGSWKTPTHWTALTPPSEKL